MAMTVIYPAIRPSKAHFYKIFKQFLDQIPPGSKVLDLGCGPMKYYHLFPKGIDYLGADLSKERLNEGLKKYPDMKTLVCDITKMNFPKNSFDYIVCTHTLQVPPLSQEEVIEAIEKLTSYLKTDGQLFFNIRRIPIDDRSHEKNIELVFRKQKVKFKKFEYRGKISRIFESLMAVKLK